MKKHGLDFVGYPGGPLKFTVLSFCSESQKFCCVPTKAAANAKIVFQAAAELPAASGGEKRVNNAKDQSFEAAGRKEINLCGHERHKAVLGL